MSLKPPASSAFVNVRYVSPEPPASATKKAKVAPPPAQTAAPAPTKYTSTSASQPHQILAPNAADDPKTSMATLALQYAKSHGLPIPSVNVKSSSTTTIPPLMGVGTPGSGASSSTASLSSANRALAKANVGLTDAKIYVDQGFKDLLAGKTTTTAAKHVAQSFEGYAKKNSTVGKAYATWKADTSAKNLVPLVKVLQPIYLKTAPELTRPQVMVTNAQNVLYQAQSATPSSASGPSAATPPATSTLLSASKKLTLASEVLTSALKNTNQGFKDIFAGKSTTAAATQLAKTFVNVPTDKTINALFTKWKATPTQATLHALAKVLQPTYLQKSPTIARLESAVVNAMAGLQAVQGIAPPPPPAGANAVAGPAVPHPSAAAAMTDSTAVAAATDPSAAAAITDPTADAAATDPSAAAAMTDPTADAAATDPSAAAAMTDPTAAAAMTDPTAAAAAMTDPTAAAAVTAPSAADAVTAPTAAAVVTGPSAVAAATDPTAAAAAMGTPAASLTPMVPAATATPAVAANPAKSPTAAASASDNPDLTAANDELAAATSALKQATDYINEGFTNILAGQATTQAAQDVIQGFGAYPEVKAQYAQWQASPTPANLTALTNAIRPTYLANSDYINSLQQDVTAAQQDVSDSQAAV